MIVRLLVKLLTCFGGEDGEEGGDYGDVDRGGYCVGRCSTGLGSAGSSRLFVASSL